MKSKLPSTRRDARWQRMCRAANRMTRAEYLDRRALLRVDCVCFLVGSCVIGIILAFALVSLLPVLLSSTDGWKVVCSAMLLLYIGTVLVVVLIATRRKHKNLRELEFQREVEDTVP